MTRVVVVFLLGVLLGAAVATGAVLALVGTGKVGGCSAQVTVNGRVVPGAASCD